MPPSNIVVAAQRLVKLINPVSTKRLAAVCKRFEDTAACVKNQNETIKILEEYLTGDSKYLFAPLLDSYKELNRKSKNKLKLECDLVLQLTGQILAAVRDFSRELQ